MIIWVLCPAGAKRGAWRYFTSSSLFSWRVLVMSPMGRKMDFLVLLGARVVSPRSEGSSMLTLSRSASIPSRVTSSGDVPGMALAWI